MFDLPTDQSGERGVSPVIGVILMIAITVILAAVIASFVLGLGPGGAAPTASFSGEYDGSGTLTITLDSSQSEIEAGDIDISHDGTTESWATASTLNSDSVITAGTSVDVSVSGDDYSVDIIYTGGEGSTVLQTLEG